LERGFGGFVVVDVKRGEFACRPEVAAVFGWTGRLAAKGWRRSRTPPVLSDRLWHNPGMPSVLVVIGGLPAVGKSTVAGAFAAETGTTYVRVDRIEQAIVAWSSLRQPVGPVGYAVAHQIAVEQLQLGLDVVVECVNPLGLTRDAWAGTATTAGAALVEVEVICSDEAEHRRRVATRASDVDGLVKPTWDEIVAREYELWGRPHLVIDSAGTSVSQAAERIAGAIRTARSQAAAATA
jgi:predicted kinase